MNTTKPIMKFTPSMLGVGVAYRLYPDRITMGSESHDLTGVRAELSGMIAKRITIIGPGWAWTHKIDQSINGRATKFVALVNAHAQAEARP